MSQYRLRKRSKLLATGTGTGYWTYPHTGDTGPLAESGKRFDFIGRQETLSRGNPVSQLGDGNLRAIGGDFSTKRLIWGLKSKKPWQSTPTPLKLYTLQGSGFFIDTSTTPLLPKPLWFMADDAWDACVSSSDDALRSRGAIAVDRVKPTNSAADLAVTLAELKREGIPSMLGLSLWKSRLKDVRPLTSGNHAPRPLKPGEKLRNLGRPVKGSAEEYLNWQFGWSPLLGDLMKAVDATSKSEKIWTQYKRDSGRLVRRRYDFPSETQLLDEHYTDNWPVEGLVTGSMFVNGAATGRLYETLTLERKTWFEGAFTYYVPDNPLLEAAAKARKLYGITLDPEVVWNLTPWSWLVDWHGGIGSSISNLSDLATDALVMRYGYIMEETVVTRTSSLAVNTRTLGPLTLTQDVTCIAKKRVEASPYGFSLGWADYSPRQLAILGALGITRAL